MYADNRYWQQIVKSMEVRLERNLILSNKRLDESDIEWRVKFEWEYGTSGNGEKKRCSRMRSRVQKRKPGF